MKNMLITATAVGVAAAGLLLYLQQKRRKSNRALTSSENKPNALSNGVGKMERPPQHAMG